jgi:DmsE family decaheme c-type cytochrome
LFNRVAPDEQPGLRASLRFLLAACMLCAAAFPAGLPEARAQTAPPTAAAPATTAAPATPAAHAEFVGADTCATCHAEEAKNFVTNPHTKMALMHGNANGVTCENCHGAGSEHVSSGGDITKIFDPAKGSRKEVDAKCLSCHSGAHPDFMRSPHARANVGCTSCHSIHASKEETLLKAPQPTLCFQCHTDTKAAFNMPFHHQVNEGLIKCTDCHDVHGTFEKSNLRSRNDSNLICTKCHTEMRGPFVYEHTPVKAEGCMGCHSPHGSQNARLLNMPSINNLCNTCHSPVASATIHGQGAGSSELAPCTSCHTYIHGSNMNVAFLR